MDGYRYATGEQTYTCDRCGALVEESATEQHDRFHGQLDALYDDVNKLWRGDDD